MENKQIGEIKYSPDLSKDEKEIVELMSDVRIRGMEPYGIIAVAAEALGASYTRLGFKLPQKEELQNLSNVLSVDLTQHCPGLTKGEIMKACSNGCAGKYGEHAGVSPAVIIRWCMQFTQEQVRMDARKKQAAFLHSSENVKEVTEKEKADIGYSEALRAFQIVSEGKWYNDIGNATYKYLDSKKLIPFNTARKFEFMEQAKRAMLNDYSKQMMNIKSVEFAREIKGIITELEQIETRDDFRKAENVKTEAMKIALNQLFKDMIEMGEELKDKL